MPQVLYKGASHAVVSLLSGEVTVQFPNPPTVLPHIKIGKLRALGVTTLNRIQVLPDVPPIAEAGLPGYEAAQWFGILARAGTPRVIIDRLNQQLNRALSTPEIKDRMLVEGIEAGTSTPEAFANRIKSETEKWAKVIKTAGIKVE